MKEAKGRLAGIVLIVTAMLLCSCPRRGEYIGTFDMSHYCLEIWDGEHSCGNSAYGIDGDRLIPGGSVAVPASVLENYPVGTRVLAVYPDGHSDKLIIHDTGSALDKLGRIDVPVRTHKKAMEIGVIKDVRLYALR